MNCPKCKSPNTVPVDENMTIIGDDWVSYDCDDCGNYFTKYYKQKLFVDVVIPPTTETINKKLSYPQKVINTVTE